MDNLTLGASTWTYLQACDLQSAVRRLQTLGYSRFDVLTIPPHLWPYDIDVAQRRALRDLLVTEGLSFEFIEFAEYRSKSMQCYTADARDTRCSNFTT